MRTTAKAAARQLERGRAVRERGEAFLLIAPASYLRAVTNGGPPLSGSSAEHHTSSRGLSYSPAIDNCPAPKPTSETTPPILLLFLNILLLFWLGRICFGVSIARIALLKQQIVRNGWSKFRRATSVAHTSFSVF